MNESVVNKIWWLMELPEMYSKPCKGGFFTTLEEKSIMRWTCMEVMLSILDHPNQDAFETIDEFWLQMVGFQHLASSKKVRSTFQMVVNAIETIQYNL